MKVWEGTDLVCCYNVAGESKLKRIRLTHAPNEPNLEKVLEFAELLLTVLPTTYSKDSVQVLTRTRYL